MKKVSIRKFNVEINPQEPLFVIGVVSDMLEIPIWTLRKLDEMGVVSPERKGKRTRCYSHVQVQTLNYVKYLMTEKEVNISGIKIILEMKTREEKDE